MKLNLENIDFFQEKYVPADTTLAGMSALIHALNIEAPLRTPACISQQRTKESLKETPEWRIFDKKYEIEPNVRSHLVFAMRNENIDLLVLKRIFLALPETEISSYVQSAPVGQITRRVWFLYEFLTDRKLDIPDCGKVSVTDLLDEKQYFTSEGIVSVRHKVRNNLLGNQHFCPIIRRTQQLNTYLSKKLSSKVQSILAKVSPQLIARAASFLLLADSQASFAIEGERLPRNKAERWLRAVQAVGRHPLSVLELNRLHSILIEERRFMKPGLREEGVFLGQRSSDGDPLPEFIGARPEDIQELLQGMIEANSIMLNSPIDAILQAAAIAFGFVYIHPYEDGNGRLHRCLIHHILAEKKFSPPGLIFPVSSVMLKWIEEYRQILQAHSSPLMNYIDWVSTDTRNVNVRNDTADLYRFFDCTVAAEFLYRCVEETIEHDVPNELDYLKRHDQVVKRLMDTVDMPDNMANDFVMFMRQNDWKLSKKRREREFKKLTDTEVIKLETIVTDGFDGFKGEGTMISENATQDQQEKLNQHNKQNLAHFLAMMQGILGLKNIIPGEEITGAFLLGNELLKTNKVFKQQTEQRGVEFLTQLRQDNYLSWQTLADLVQKVIDLNLPEVVAQLSGQIIGIMLYMDEQVQQNSNLHNDFQKRAQEFLA